MKRLDEGWRGFSRDMMSLSRDEEVIWPGMNGLGEE